MITNQPKQILVRPKFVGYSLLIFAIPLALATLSLPQKYGIAPAGSLALLSVPICYFTIRCLTTKESDAADLLSLRHARAIYFPCLIASLMFWMFKDLSYSGPGFFATFIFGLREPIIRKIARGVLRADGAGDGGAL